MTITKNSTKFRSAIALTFAAMLAACASAPQSNARLDQARAAYEAAARDAQVVRSAPVELQRAQQALQQAQTALRASTDVAEVEHYAYLAQRRTEVAQQAGLIAKADQAVAQSQAERDKILIASRTRDADKARADADAARKLAEDRLAAATLARKQTEEASRRAGSLEAQLAAMKAKATDRGMVLTLGDVLFDSGQARLKPGAMRTVGQVAAFLAKNPARRVLIEGHTDSQGSESLNRDLSQRRADAVRNALVDRRISADRVETHGLGEGYPVASNDNAAGRQQNRRVELIFSDDSGAIKARVN